MEFGKIDESLLDTIDFTLPSEPDVNKKVLTGKKVKTKFYIGCAKWGRKDWVGKLYPQGSKEKDFLQLYAHIFNSIEFNATFYKAPTIAQVETWKSKVPKGFLFCPKFPQTITHLRRLNNTRFEVDEFLKSITAFGDSMGPIFLLPNPQMSPKHLETIEHFITDLPRDIDVFLELRHPEWYVHGYNKDLYNFLYKSKKGTIITDAAGRRDCVHMHLSTPEAFIRFVGNSLHPTDYKRIDDWVQRIKIWMNKGLKTCYFFMHQHEELHSPELIKYFIEQLNYHCGLSISAPEMHLDDNTLF